MTFNPNLPNPGDRLSVSQGQLKANNIALDATFSQNHVAFSQAINNGKHTFIQLPNQPAIPPGLVNGDETFYSKALAGNGELLFTRGSNGIEIQLTGPGNPTPASPAVFTAQTGTGTVTGTSRTFLPGGMILFFGKVTNVNVSSSGQDILFPGSGFPNGAFVAYGIATSSALTQNASVTVKSGSLSTGGVTFFCPTAAANSLFWWALGN